ncbi:MAG: ABC-type amino acid transport substrate-binding protein, partial [Candidatus Krumholzibacteriia bacterium]
MGTSIQHQPWVLLLIRQFGIQRRAGRCRRFVRRSRNLLVIVWLFAQSPVADAQTFQVTDEERAWLDAHPIIRLAPAPNFPPMEFFDEQGVYRGVMADYTKILEDRLGIKFEIANYETWQGVVTATKAREVDVWMEAQDTPERREYLSITEPYVHLPVVIIVRHDKKGVLQLSDLTGLKVAVIEGYASAKFV